MDLISNTFQTFINEAPQQARAPLISSIYAGLHGLPPIFIQVGDREILMSDTLRLDGVSTELEVWEGRWHGWHLSACHVPEGEQAIDKIGAFILNQLEEAA